MRLDINLASQPYEDARQFWMRWGTALVAVAILTLALVATTISGWFAARKDHATAAVYRVRIAERDLKRRQAEQFLNRPENRSTRDESQYINELIERKSFSWTRVLEDMEKVMPPRVHLVSIHPELDEDNQLKLKMSIAGNRATGRWSWPVAWKIRGALPGRISKRRTSVRRTVETRLSSTLWQFMCLRRFRYPR